VFLGFGGVFLVFRQSGAYGNGVYEAFTIDVTKWSLPTSTSLPAIIGIECDLSY